MNEFSLSCSSFLPRLVGVVSERQRVAEGRKQERVSSLD
jgi:hypothetical protein